MGKGFDDGIIDSQFFFFARGEDFEGDLGEFVTDDEGGLCLGLLGGFELLGKLSRGERVGNRDASGAQFAREG